MKKPTVRWAWLQGGQSVQAEGGKQRIGSSAIEPLLIADHLLVPIACIGDARAGGSSGSC